MMHDVVIIGGGHNGLVCSAYLAIAGFKVMVLDQRPVVGGAAVTEEFSPGFSNSVASYTVSLLNPKIIRDLNLGAHGLRIVERPIDILARHDPRAASGKPVGIGLHGRLVSWIIHRVRIHMRARDRGRRNSVLVIGLIRLAEGAARA